MNMRGLCAGLVLIFPLIFTVTACASTAKETPKAAPAKVAETSTTGPNSITLTQRAAERLGITLSPVRDGGGDTLALPYSAVVYHSDGTSWVFTNPQTLVYLRVPVVVDRIQGDTAYVHQGPAAGTSIVTAGSAELFGAELGIGK
jgi:multidrug efflux pump subunit AcrA (membrane-fusion protein)